VVAAQRRPPEANNKKFSTLEGCQKNRWMREKARVIVIEQFWHPAWVRSNSPTDPVVFALLRPPATFF